jgi:2-dehydro-3-deoxyphosphogluconate aldolase / (4S)-4-hydroxy-2-oxoglutarate aldolase
MTADALRNGPVADQIRRYRLVVVLRRVEPESALIALVDELADAGARVFEVTFDAPTAESDVRALRGRLGARSDGPFLVGAGTILRRGQLEAARRAEADFAVAPVLDTGLVDTAVSEGIPFVPGAFTPTEVDTAWAAGATFVKLFPASTLGPSFVRELRGPLPEVQLIPTGGVNADNAGAFIEAGAVAVGVGGALVRGDEATRRAIVAAVIGGPVAKATRARPGDRR